MLMVKLKRYNLKEVEQVNGQRKGVEGSYSG